MDDEDLIQSRIAALDGPDARIREHVFYLKSQLAKVQQEKQILQNDRLFELFTHFLAKSGDKARALQETWDALTHFTQASN